MNRVRGGQCSSRGIRASYDPARSGGQPQDAQRAYVHAFQQGKIMSFREWLTRQSQLHRKVNAITGLGTQKLSSMVLSLLSVMLDFLDSSVHGGWSRDNATTRESTANVVTAWAVTSREGILVVSGIILL